MQLALDWNRDAFTRGNFTPGGEMLESRRDSPQNTRVAPLISLLTLALKLHFTSLHFTPLISSHPPSCSLYCSPLSLPTLSSVISLLRYQYPPMLL